MNRIAWAAAAGAGLAALTGCATTTASTSADGGAETDQFWQAVASPDATEAGTPVSLKDARTKATRVIVGKIVAATPGREYPVSAGNPMKTLNVTVQTTANPAEKTQIEYTMASLANPATVKSLPPDDLVFFLSSSSYKAADGSTVHGCISQKWCGLLLQGGKLVSPISPEVTQVLAKATPPANLSELNK